MAIDPLLNAVQRYTGRNQNADAVLKGQHGLEATRVGALRHSSEAANDEIARVALGMKKSSAAKVTQCRAMVLDAIDTDERTYRQEASTQRTIGNVEIFSGVGMALAVVLGGPVGVVAFSAGALMAGAGVKAWVDADRLDRAAQEEANELRQKLA